MGICPWVLAWRLIRLNLLARPNAPGISRLLGQGPQIKLPLEKQQQKKGNKNCQQIN